jgi:hypothetical protein
VAQLAGPEREIALLLDHRANLVVERTRTQARMRWLLFELDPSIELARRSCDSLRVLERLKRQLAKQPPSILLRVCRELLARVTQLTKQIRALERELRPMVRRHAGPLLALPGIGILNAARILANVADVRRFSSEAKLALYAGVAPLDASSGRQQRHRLNRSGNRQLNSALHMIALTQVRIYAPAREYVARRREEGKTGRGRWCRRACAWSVSGLSHPRPQTPPHPHPLPPPQRGRQPHRLPHQHRPQRALHHIGVIEPAGQCLSCSALGRRYARPCGVERRIEGFAETHLPSHGWESRGSPPRAHIGPPTTGVKRFPRRRNRRPRRVALLRRIMEKRQ